MRVKVMVGSVLVVVVALSAPAYAGGPDDPVGGEQRMGQVAGLKYLKEQLAVGSSGHFTPPTEAAWLACGGHASSWHTVAGGAKMSGANADNRIAALRPMDLDAVFESPDNTVPDDWWDSTVRSVVGRTLTGYTICTKRALTYRVRTVPSGTSTDRAGQVSCPAGKHVVGGGAFIATTDSYLNSSYPLKRGWRTRVYDTVGGAGGMQVYAVCRGLGQVRRVTATVSGVAAGSTRTAIARCRASEHVAGGGGRITGTISEAHLAASTPYDGADSGSLPDDGWKVVAVNDSGTDKSVSAVALCVKKG
jgi:hypothetical protein